MSTTPRDWHWWRQVGTKVQPATRGSVDAAVRALCARGVQQGAQTKPREPLHLRAGLGCP